MPKKVEEVYSDSFLSDHYHAEGKGLQEFYSTLNKFSASTSVAEVDPGNCDILSIIEVGGVKQLIRMTPSEPVKTEGNKLVMEIQPYDRKAFVDRFSEEIVNEAENTGFYMCMTKDMTKAFPVSNLAMLSIQNRTGISGDSSLGRNMTIAERFQKISESQAKLNIVSCLDSDLGNKNSRKIFGVMSDGYIHIEQDLIKKIIDKILDDNAEGLGKPECKHWEVDHTISRVYLEFPDAEKELQETYKLPDSMIPGLMIETSDIGMSAFRLKGYFRTKNSLFFCAEDFTKKHTGEDAEEDILLKAVNERIFPKFTIYPEKLFNLLGIEVIEVDIPEVDRVETLNEVFEDVFKYTGLDTLLGKRRMKAIKAVFDEEFNKNEAVSGYDIAQFVLGLDQIADFKSKNLKRNVQEMTARVLNYTFD